MPVLVAPAAPVIVPYMWWRERRLYNRARHRSNLGYSTGKARQGKAIRTVMVGPSRRGRHGGPSRRGRHGDPSRRGRHGGPTRGANRHAQTHATRARPTDLVVLCLWVSKGSSHQPMYFQDSQSRTHRPCSPAPGAYGSPARRLWRSQADAAPPMSHWRWAGGVPRPGGPGPSRCWRAAPRHAWRSHEPSGRRRAAAPSRCLGACASPTRHSRRSSRLHKECSKQRESQGCTKHLKKTEGSEADINM